MKLTKRLIALLLAVLMLPVWNPNVAAAVEVPKPDKADTGTLIGNANPLYQGVVDADSFQMPAFPDHSDADAQVQATYVSEAQAATQLKNYMKNRTESFTIYVTSASSNVQAIVDNMVVNATVHNGNAREGDYLAWQWGRWDASYSRDWTGSVYNYTLDLVFVYYTTAAQENKVNTAVNNLISSLGLSGKSDYQKIKAVYDWICANVTYDYENLYDDTYTLKFSAYAALIDRNAVCQGYALLFYRLMLELGIDARFIAGIGGGGAHGWNIVELNDLYYNVDSTWDAGMSDYGFFLTNTWNFADHYRYLDYETWEFHEEYPMAAENYTPGVAGEVDPCIFMDYCGDSAAFMLERDGTLTIGGTGATWDYSDAGPLDGGSPWRYWGSHIKKLVVEEGITRLGDYSFYDNMSNLKSASLPDSLKEIGERAFCYCTGLTKITLPDSLEFIDSYAFECCNSLTSVTIPASVTTLDYHVFNRCENLESVKVYCPTVGRATFAFCQKLTDVYLSDNVTVLGSEAFRRCTALTEITIPASVVAVDSGAFEDCTALENIYFLGDMPQLQYYTFHEVTANAYYPMGNTSWNGLDPDDFSGNITWIPMLDVPEVKISNVASTGKIKLTWDKVDGAVKYKVYSSTSKDGPFKLLKTVTGTSLTHSSAVAGEKYYYCVKAVDSEGNTSFKSNIVTRVCDLPRPVITVKNNYDTGKIRIEWDAIEGAVKYEVYRSTDNKTWTLLKTTTSTGLNNTSVTFGNKYYYKVKAIASESAANSAYSTVKSDYCILPRTKVTLSNVSSTGKIRLKWTAVENAVQYKVYSSTDNKTWKLLKTTTGTSLTNTKAEAGKLYYYKVKAIAADTELNAAYSQVVSRYCDLPRPTLKVSLNSAGKPSLSWNAIEGAEKYEVYRSTDGGNSWKLLKTTTGTSLTHSGATEGLNYSYRIRAIAANSGANSSYSAAVTVLVPAITALEITRQPASLNLELEEGESFTIDFEAVGDGLSYKWYYKTAGSDAYLPDDTVTGNSYTGQMTAELDGCQIYCEVTDQYGNSVATEVVTLAIVVVEEPAELTEEAVYASMIAMQSEYPEGMAWTNDNFYAWNGGIYGGGYGCAGFAFLLSDAAFGELPARMIEENISIDMVRVGDILRVNGNTHSVIILEVHEDYIVIAEGNYNSSIHWGRTLTAEDVAAADYVLTRYPE